MKRSQKFRSSRAPWAGLLVLVAAAAFMVSATASGGSAASGKTTADSPLVKMAKAKVASYEAGPKKWPGPTTPFKPGKFKAAVLACGFAAPVCAVHAKEEVKALRAMGWSVPPAVDGQFSAQVQSAFLDRAVQQKLAGVMMFSIDVTSVKAAVDRAAKAGLQIVCVACISYEFRGPPKSKGWVYDVTANFVEQGEMDAWKVLSEAGDQAKVAIFTDKSFDPQPLRVVGFNKIFNKYCPKCEKEVIPFVTGDIAKPGPPAFTALLSKKPEGELTHVVGHYEGMGSAMKNTLKQVGRTDVKVVTYDTSLDVTTSIAKGNEPLVAASAAPWTYADWAGADMLGRLKAGVKLWPGAAALPSTLLTVKNAKNYLPPKTSDPTPPGNWRASFTKLWVKG